jgi:hypothetical protein
LRSTRSSLTARWCSVARKVRASRPHLPHRTPHTHTRLPHVHACTAARITRPHTHMHTPHSRTQMPAPSPPRSPTAHVCVARRPRHPLRTHAHTHAHSHTHAPWFLPLRLAHGPFAALRRSSHGWLCAQGVHRRHRQRQLPVDGGRGACQTKAHLTRTQPTHCGITAHHDE